MIRAQWLKPLMLPAAIWGCGDPSGVSPPPPVPTLTALTPDSTVAGGPVFTLTVRGTNLGGDPPGRRSVMWEANGHVTGLATTVVSRTELTALVPAALLDEPGTASVFLIIGNPRDDHPLVQTNDRLFTIAPRPMGLVTITAIDPDNARAGSSALTVTITGRNFPHNRLSASLAVWVSKVDTTVLATTFVDSTRLTAVVPADLLTQPDTARLLIQVREPMEGTLRTWSNTATFTVVPLESGAVMVSGLVSGRPRRVQGSREVSLDDSPWHTLVEGESFTYIALAAGSHQLMLSNPCTASHQPSLQLVNVTSGDTTVVPVPIPPECE